MFDTDKTEYTNPIFTIKDDNVIKDDVFYWSLKKIYFSYDHVPGFEYEFAKDVFHSCYKA